MKESMLGLDLHCKSQSKGGCDMASRFAGRTSAWLGSRGSAWDCFSLEHWLPLTTLRDNEDAVSELE